MQNSQLFRARLGLGLIFVSVVLFAALVSEWLFLFFGVLIGAFVWVEILSGFHSRSAVTAEPLTLVQDGVTYTAAEGVDLNVAISAKPYVDWLATVDRGSFNLRGVHFQSLDMFGPTKVGFVKFKADAVDDKGRFVPGIILARGGSVAVLVVLVCDGREYAVLTVQPRLAVGQIGFEEVCAGMLDGSGNFAGVAAKELEEELGIKISPEELVDLTRLAGLDRGIFLSPGACEEFMHFFALVRHVSREEMEEMNGRIAGLEEEGEQIILKIVPLECLQTIADAKTLIIFGLYERLRHHVPGSIGHDVPFDRGGGEYHGLAPVGKAVYFDSNYGGQ